MSLSISVAQHAGTLLQPGAQTYRFTFRLPLTIVSILTKTKHTAATTEQEMNPAIRLPHPKVEASLALYKKPQIDLYLLSILKIFFKD